jgi:hypothetical protein
MEPMNIQPFDHVVKVTKATEYDYQIFTMWSKDSVNTTAQGLLNLASWVELHRAQLEQEARTSENEQEGE